MQTMDTETALIRSRLPELFVKALRLHIPPSEVDGDDLVTRLGIDSVSSLELLIWIEDEFGIQVEDEDLSAKLVDSLDYLANYIARKRGEGLVRAPAEAERGLEGVAAK